MAGLLFRPVFLAVAFSAFLLGTEARSTQHKDLLWFPKDGPSGFLPAFLNSAERGLNPPVPRAEDVHFYLFTQRNPTVFDELFETSNSIDNSHWDSSAPVKIFAHGFGSSHTGGSGTTMREGYMDGFPTDVNLVLVDWESLAAAPFYDSAAANTEYVGGHLATFIAFLLDNGYTTLGQLHVGGHSLGAHVAGYAGRFLQETTSYTLQRVTGLDPALPLFGGLPDSNRIDPSDAGFVDIIHTASETALVDLSFLEPRGHADFYPNKGSNQPGCGLDLFATCSHRRCYEFFAESVSNDNFVACKCLDNSWDPDFGDDFASCNCDRGSARMGAFVDTSIQGIFYLETNAEPPFALG